MRIYSKVMIVNPQAALNIPSERAVSRTILGILVIVVVLIASAGAYYGFVARGGKSAAKTSLQVDEPNEPDTLDPAVTYETSGWEPIEQIYQGLITCNGTSYTTYEGVLADSWVMSSSGLNYTFHLRHGVTFSNGDPFNAYVMWYSLYRTIVMNQAPSWILEQNLAAGNGLNFNVTDSMLNSINYTNPSAADLAIMNRTDQSVRALNASMIQFNLGWGYNGPAPYSAFLATLITPMAFAVDPAFVHSHGGVVAAGTNDYLTTNALGTGFYKLQSWVMGQSLSLVRNPNYWAASLPKSELNNAISPAILNNVVIYYKDALASIGDLRSGATQMISVPVTYYNVTKGISGVTTSVLPLVYGAAADVHYIYMDTAAFPLFNNLDVRKAIALAIDYEDIVHVVFGGHAGQWVGPVPPGFQYYNESTVGLSPYQYDPVQAAVSLARAGFRSYLPNGTTLNSGGKSFPSVKFLFDSDNPTDINTAQIVRSNLAMVGIPIVLTSLPSREYSTLIYSSSTDNTTYAMGLGYYSEDYTASIDYVYFFTSTNQIGSSAYNDSEVVNWTTEAATAIDSSTIAAAFSNITRNMYQNYTDIWLYVPQQMPVHVNSVTGMIPNPAGSAMGYFLYYNTINYTS
ncbi:MAG: ABC transporter substrate-binding protein [Nitrososphaerales archaeon]|jgi:peptide/nickel transport system substrate-binding protein